MVTGLTNGRMSDVTALVFGLPMVKIHYRFADWVLRRDEQRMFHLKGK
jgi:hypothetical protein